jgi:large subunit ribosomal protein L6
MSRIGKLPVIIPKGVKIEVTGTSVKVQGAKGSLTCPLHPSLQVTEKDGHLIVNRQGDEKQVRALHGLTRSLLSNMIHGVSEGYSRSLMITGMGYRAAKQGGQISLNIGFSHPVVIKAVPGIEIDVEGTNKIVIRGSDKQKVGQVAADIRAIRPPDSYKGKGILYEGERLKLKLGKAGKVATKK